MTRCTCPKCAPKEKTCSRLYRSDMSPKDQYNYASPHFWCQCGAWKYYDASCCDDCWKEREAYIDR